MSQGTTIKKSVCTWCKGECGVLVHSRNGQLIEVEPDPEWPLKIYPPIEGCVRRKAAGEFFYHPDRVNFPLKRAGEKGEGRWKIIPWDQALDEIAGKLQKIKENYGPEAVGLTTGTAYRTEQPPRHRFFHLFGSPNHFSAVTICFGPRANVADAIAGMFPNFSVKPMTKCIVLLGIEPLVSRPYPGHVMLEAKKRGAKLIVIDPARTRSASMADVWLPVRPGTDAALLLGMITVIINEDLYDKEFVDKWCYGFDKLKERANEYPLEKAQTITGIPAEKIAEAARMYASNRPACFLEGMGLEELYNAAEILHARWILSALTANIDVEGGDEQSGPHPQIISLQECELSDRLSPIQKGNQIGNDRFRLLARPGRDLIVENMRKAWAKPAGLDGNQGAAHAPSVFRAILTGKPYPVKAVITEASNPMVTLANTKLVYKALKSLDLYVVIDHWKTPSAELADYILPAACWLERPILWDFNGYGNYMLAGEAALPSAIPGQYDHRTDYDFWRGLGIRLEQKENWPWQTLEEYYDYRLKPLGYTHNEYVHNVRIELRHIAYKKYEKQGFGTPTGKVELYSTIFEKLGYDPLPKHTEPPETIVSDPVLAQEYPLTLITGRRILEYYHSEERQIESIRKRRPDPLVEIHPDTATKLGINEGDWVWIESPRGRIRQKAKLFDGMAPNIVHAEHGWWFPELPGEEPWLHGVWESNVNVLTDDDPDVCGSIIGSWPLRTALCKVYKVKNFTT